MVAKTIKKSSKVFIAIPLGKIDLIKIEDYLQLKADYDSKLLKLDDDLDRIFLQMDGILYDCQDKIICVDTPKLEVENIEVFEHEGVVSYLVTEILHKGGVYVLKDPLDFHEHCVNPDVVKAYKEIMYYKGIQGECDADQGDEKKEWHGKMIKSGTHKRYSDWQKKAEELKKSNKRLSKSDISRRVGKFFDVSNETVRAVIKI